MNRRGFIGALAAAAFALDPDRALWVPGAKLISIPRPPRIPVRVIDRGWVAENDFVVRRFPAVHAAAMFQGGVDLWADPDRDYTSRTQGLADFEYVRPELARIMGVHPDQLYIEDWGVVRDGGACDAARIEVLPWPDMAFSANGGPLLKS